MPSIATTRASSDSSTAPRASRPSPPPREELEDTHLDLPRPTNASALRAMLGKWLLAKPNWWIQFTIVAAVGLAGLMALGTWTYTSAPPRVAFVSSTTGKEVVSLHQILRGQELFHIRGLMSWGSFWGDGAERGPDFTADALHRTVVSMRSFYAQELEKERPLTQADRDAITVRVQREIKENRYDEASGVIRINDAQSRAYEDLQTHYTRMFTDPTYPAKFKLDRFITDPDDLRSLAAYFFWGGWVSGASRPGGTCSYPHRPRYAPHA